MSFDFIGFLTLLSLISTSGMAASSSCSVRSFEGSKSNKEASKEIDLSPFTTQSCQTNSFIKDIEKFQENSLQKMNIVLKDKGFQQLIAELKDNEPKDLASGNVNTSPALTPSSCYIFVSFSLGEKALLNLAQDAKKWGSTLVLKGFKDGSYKKTALALQKIIQQADQGFIIDPELFNLFAITAVPTIILAKPFPLLSTERVQAPLYDRLQGHVSLRYALETFAKEGDLKEEAKAHLRKEGGR